MSLSGSAAEDFNKTGDAALHYDDEPKGPEPTPENPGGVHPQVSGGPAQPGSTPGSGAPDHGGDVRGVFSNVLDFGPSGTEEPVPASIPLPLAAPLNPDPLSTSPLTAQPLMFRQVFSDLSSAFTTAIHAIEDESGSGIGNVGKTLIAKLEAMRGEVDGLRQGKGLEGAEEGEKGGEVERVGEGGLYAN